MLKKPLFLFCFFLILIISYNFIYTEKDVVISDTQILDDNTSQIEPNSTSNKYTKVVKKDNFAIAFIISFFISFFMSVGIVCLFS